MNNNFIAVKGKDFILNNKSIMLRGFGIGSWMNIEHFMIHIPGTESMIRKAFADMYGKKNSDDFFDAYIESFLTDDDFLYLKKLGINVVRLAINYRHFIDDLAPGKFREKGFFHLDRVLALCKKHGIYAVLDIHAVPGGQNPDWHSDSDLGISLFWAHACFQKQITELWACIADRYHDNPFIAGYDLVNEPSFVPDRVAFNRFINDTIKSIRASDKNHIIFLEGDDWAKDFSIFDPVEDESTAYSFHLYPFFVIKSRSTEEKARDELRKAIEPFIALREDKSKPLWCGETGNRFAKEDIAYQTMILNQMLGSLEEKNVSWTVWSFKDAGSMSLLNPGAQTPWTRLTDGMFAKWNFDKEDEYTDMVMDHLEKNIVDKMEPGLRRRMSFRIRGIMQNIYLDQIVRPKLKEIPWDEIKEYPASFLFKNCEPWNEVEGIIQSYTKNGNGING